MDCSSASEIPDLLEKIFLCASSVESLYDPRLSPTRFPFERYYKPQTLKKNSTQALKETSSSEQSSRIRSFQAYNICEQKGSHRANLCISEKPPQKKLKRQPQPAKKIHNTISNQENSLYFVVSRQKTDKVYEIKTSVTGSATLLKIKPDTCTFTINAHVTDDAVNTDKILESVRMEKKKKKTEEKPNNEEPKADRYKIRRSFGNTPATAHFGQNAPVCHCPFITNTPKRNVEAKDFRPNEDGNKSRVRIMGRLGVTEDDKYVLNCAATIDDQPVETHYADMKGSDSPRNIFFCQNQCRNMHTETKTKLVNKNEETHNICRKGSASTQVNLNLFFNDDTDQKDETVQCSCGNTNDMSTFTEDEVVRESATNTPLVVISVFKKHRGQGQSDFDIKVSEAGDVTIFENKFRNNELPQKINATESRSPFEAIEAASSKNAKTNTDRPTKVKSATPTRNAYTPRNERRDLSKTVSPVRNIPKPRTDASPDRRQTLTKGNQTPSKPKFEPYVNRKKPAPRTDSSPERNKIGNKPNNNIPQRNPLLRTNNASPERTKPNLRTNVTSELNKPANRVNKQVTSTKTKEIAIKGAPYSVKLKTQREGVTEKNKTKITFETINPVSPRRSPMKQDTPERAKNTNVDLLAAKAKQSLVESFMRNVTEKMTPNKRAKSEEPSYSGAESCASRVTVNIDAENEIYDLLFQQDSNTTDWSIRKTRKVRGSPKQPLEYYHENLSGSLENFLVSPEENDRQRSVSHTWNFDDNYAIAPSVENPKPPLKVIDSIEISHKREEKSNTNHSIKLTQANSENIIEQRDDPFTAPAKHYPGDKCPIVDPMQREMEIRELLGVQKRKCNPKDTANAKVDTILHKDTLKIRNCPHQTRKNNVMCLLNQHSPFAKMIERSECLNHAPYTKSTSTQCDFMVHKDIQIQLETFQISEKDLAHKSKSISLGKPDYYKVRKLILKSLAQKTKYRIFKRVNVILPREVREKRKKSKRVIFVEKSTQTDKAYGVKKTKKKDYTLKKAKGFDGKERTRTEVDNKHKYKIDEMETKGIVAKESKKMVVLFHARKENSFKENDGKQDLPSRTLSAVEVRYAKVAYLTNAFASDKNTKMKLISQDNLVHNENYQEETFSTFKETRKRVITSPNLGLSGLSLCGEPASVTSSRKPPVVVPPRKPLLRRLVSCLAFRSKKVAQVKQDLSTPKLASKGSSVDWYQVTSSCAPFEMSSSIYDTSASFYTNHFVEPIPTKSKQRFLSSVWNMFAP